LKHLWQRRTVTWLALVLAFALVAAACGDDDVAETTTTTTTTPEETTTTTTEAPFQKPYGGEVSYAQDQEPPTLNTFMPGGDNFVVSIVGNSYWTGVWNVDGFTLELIPEVVTELPTVANEGVAVNPDGTMTVRYQIREEAVWADGVPISGDDFLFTYETIMDPDLPISKTIYEDIIPESVSAGPKTFEYTMTAPTVQFEFLFGVLIPKHDVEGTDFANDYNDAMWVSGGPFILDEWQRGSFIRVVRNDNYWKTDPETGQQLPYLDSVLFPFIPETTSLINAFKEREVDIINPPPAIATIEDLQTLEPEGARVEVLTGPIWEHLNFSFSENSLDRNPNSYNAFLEYRQAVAHAIDLDLIVDEILAGQVEPMDSYVEAYSPTLSLRPWAQYDYNPERGRELIAELCARDDTDCDARPPTAVFTSTAGNEAREQLSELFTEMFAAIGVEYEIDMEPSTLFFGETLDTGHWDLGEWAWVGTPGFAGLIGIHDLWAPSQVPPDGQNYYRWGTAAVEGVGEGFDQGPSLVINEETERTQELRDAMNATVDVDELIALMNEMEQLLADNVVIIPLYQRLDPGAVWADTVGGFKHNPSQAAITWNMEFWYRIDLMD
jgi:peptide/nickel transport system substrate-binding protein